MPKLDPTDASEIKAHCHRITTEAVSISLDAQMLRHGAGVDDAGDLFYKVHEMGTAIEKLAGYHNDILRRVERARRG